MKKINLTGEELATMSYDDVAYIILENNQTLEIIEVSKTELPTSIHEGSILIYKDNKYIELIDEELEKRKKIEERFKRLRSN